MATEHEVREGKGGAGDPEAPQPGDYFLLPFAGQKIDLLVKAVAPHALSAHWHAEFADGRTNLVLLSSCYPCSPSEAHKILEPPSAGQEAKKA